MANIFTPGGAVSGPWFIDRDDCIGDSLGYINANTNYLGNRININTSSITSLSSQLLAATAPGTVLQSTYIQLTSATILADTSLPAVQFPSLSTVTLQTRIQPTSKILIELTGGRHSGGSTNRGCYTWFYVSENDNSFAIPRFGGIATALNAVEQVYGNYFYEGPHSARLVYTPAPTVTKITARIAVARRTSNYSWHLTDANANVPLVFSITEIKS